MNGSALERVFRAASGRITAALVARFRDMTLAEDAFSESCLRAIGAWQDAGVPQDPAAWLYQVATRVALDMLRRQRTRQTIAPDPPPPDPTAEDIMTDDRQIIPDEMLRLIFICCHPAVAPDARAALTLRLVCGLSVIEIARAFLVEETTLAQRLVRAKRKIGDAAVPFELPAPQYWPERLESVLSSLEIAYSKAHEDAAGQTQHAGFAAEMLQLSTVLADLLPDEGEVHALAALLHYSRASSCANRRRRDDDPPLRTGPGAVAPRTDRTGRRVPGACDQTRPGQRPHLPGQIAGLLVRAFEPGPTRALELRERGL